MTTKDAERLAQIRANNEKWIALTKEADFWDSTFLVRIIDQLIAEKKVKTGGFIPVWAAILLAFTAMYLLQTRGSKDKKVEEPTPLAVQK